MDLKSFNWRKIQGYLDPQAAEDLNTFLEKLPQTAGNTGLIAAGIAWGAAGAIGLYTAVQIQSLTELRAELQDMQALKPSVPRLRDAPVSQSALADFTKILERTYPGLTFRQTGASIQITARNIGLYGTFREAVGHVQNGGTGWRVAVERMCVGRECDREPLGALLRINQVSVDAPS